MRGCLAGEALVVGKLPKHEESRPWCSGVGRGLGVFLEEGSWFEDTTQRPGARVAAN